MESAHRDPAVSRGPCFFFAGSLSCFFFAGAPLGPYPTFFFSSLLLTSHALTHIARCIPRYHRTYVVNVQQQQDLQLACAREAAQSSWWRRPHYAGDGPTPLLPPLPP